MKNSLNKIFIKIIVISSVIPAVMTVGLLISLLNKNEEKLQIVNSHFEKVTKNSTNKALADSVVRASIMSASSELVNYLNSPSELRPYISTLLYGKLNDIAKKDPLITGWVVKDENHIILEQELPENLNISNLSDNNFVVLSNEYYAFQIPLKYDDQYLSGPNSQRLGSLGVVLSKRILLEVVPGLLGITKFPNQKNLNKLEIKVKPLNNPGSINFYIILLVIGFLYIMFILYGFIQINKKIINPIVGLNTMVSGENSKLKNLSENEIDLLKINFNNYIKSFKETQRREIEARESNAIADQARQVSHDIRSPLSALEILVSHANELSEDKRQLLKSAVNRISSIANVLGKKAIVNKPASDTTSKINPSSLLAEIVREKKIEYFSKNVEISLSIEKQSILKNIEANKGHLQRVFSNIINNSIEACDDTAKISINAKAVGDQFYFTIKDNGKGIPKEILGEIGKKGFSYNKSSGSGLGLYSAINYIESIKGELSMTSETGKGTAIEVKLPLVKNDKWSLGDLNFIEDKKLSIVLEDDLTCFNLIEQKIKGKKLHFTSSSKLIEYLKSIGNLDEFAGQFLFDHEIFDDKFTGLDVVQEMNLKDNVILITNRYDDPKVILRAEQLGVKIFPKSLLTYI